MWFRFWILFVFHFVDFYLFFTFYSKESGPKAVRFRFQMHSSRFQLSAASGILEICPQGVENEGKHWTRIPDKLETVSTDRQTCNRTVPTATTRQTQQTATNHQQADSKQTRRTERQIAGTLPFHQ